MPVFTAKNPAEQCWRIGNARRKAFPDSPEAGQQPLLAGFGEKVADQHTARNGLVTRLARSPPPG